MGRKTGDRENYRVVVTPGRAVWISFGGRSDEEITCDRIVDDIKRHVDDVGSVEVEYDQSYACEFCGNVWTEESTAYNGGCCDDDEEAEQDRQAVFAQRSGATA